MKESTRLKIDDLETELFIEELGLLTGGYGQMPSVAPGGWVKDPANTDLGKVTTLALGEEASAFPGPEFPAKVKDMIDQATPNHNSWPWGGDFCGTHVP